MKSTLLRVLLTAATMAAPVPWRADQATPLSWRIEQADVRVTCPMTIGGSFDATTTDLTGSVIASAPGSPLFDGTLAVDLRTLDTGIGLRNNCHLREKYLEVDKGSGFDAATLTNIGLIGLQADAPEGKGTFTASLTVHGITKAVTGSVDVSRANTGGLRVKALFPLTLSDFSIATPRFLGMGVKDIVRVQVAFAAAQ